MFFKKITKFEQLVESILNEKGKTPGKIKRHSNYIASGPQDLKRGGSEKSGIISKTDFIRRLEQNKIGERAKDKGGVIAGRAFNNLIKTFRFVLSQPVQASQLKSVVEDYSQVYGLLGKTRKNLSRESNPEKRAVLQSEAEELAEKLEEMAPDFYDQVLITMDGIYNDVVNLINDESNEIVPDEQMSAEEYAKTFYDPEFVKSNFNRFIQAYSQGGEKNPIPLIISLFKTALIKNKEDDVVGDLPKLMKVLTTKSSKSIGNIGSSHAGRQALQKKKPQQAEIVKLIKKGEVDQALAMADGELKNTIQKFKDGSISEGDVVRLIYQRA